MKAKYSFTTLSLMLLLMLGIRMANDMNNTAVAVLNRHIITIGNYKNPVYDDTGDGSSPSPSGRKAAILNNKINNDYIKDDLKKQILTTIIEYQAFTEKFCALLKDIKESTSSTHKYKANNVNEMMKIVKAYIVSFGINEDYVENLRYKPNVEYNFELFCTTLQELDLDEHAKLTDLESNIKYAFVVNQVIDYMWMMIGRINSTNFENAKAIFRKLASDAEVSKIERERKLFTHVEEVYRSTAHLASSGCQVKLKVGNNNAMSINDVRLTLGLGDNDSYKSLYYEDKLYTSIYNFLGAYGDARDYDAMVHVQLRDEEFFNHVLKDLLSNGDALNKLKHGIERNHSEIHMMICISMPVISLNKANECYSINSIFEKETDLDKIIALLTAYRDKIIGGYLDEDFLVLADLRTKMEQKHLQSGTAKTVKFILFTDKKVFMDYFMKLLNERKDIDKVRQILELYNDIYRNVDYSFASNLWIESVGMSKYLSDNKSDL